MKNRVAILAGVVWHQYANLVFSIHLDFKRLHNIESAGSNPEFGGAAFLFLLLIRDYFLLCFV